MKKFLSAAFALVLSASIVSASTNVTSNMWRPAGTELRTVMPAITDICNSDGSNCNTFGAAGDMTKAVYDPTNVSGDAFDSANTAYDNTGTDLTSVKVEDAITESVKKRANSSSGLLSGGLMTIDVDTTKFSISDGSGVVVDNSDPANPVYTDVSWSGLTGITPSFLATGPASYISINSSGAVEQSATLYTRAAARERILLGGLSHVNLTNIDTAIPFTLPLINHANQFDDLNIAYGSVNVDDGNVYGANGANLKLNRSAGEIFTLGGNYFTDNENPNFITTSLDSALTFLYTYDDGASGWTIETGTTDVTPARYDDDDGTPGTVEDYQWTVQKIYFETGGTTIIHLGQNVYNSKEEALVSIDSEDFDENPILEGFIRRGALVVKGDATDLSDDDQAIFKEYIRNGDLIQGLTVSQGVTNLYNLANGSVIDESSQTITESAGTVYFNIERDGGGDLVVQFGGENFTFDSSPAAQLALTAGSDTAPTQNFVYFTRTGSTVNLVKNTTGWPLTEYAPLAEVYVQSASSVGTDGPYDHHAWINEMGNGQGHLDHINFWIRQQGATWLDGVAPTTTITVNGGAIDNVYFSSASGNMLQMHKHAVPAKDMQTGDPAFVVNDSTTAFDRVTDLSAIDTDSTGATLRSNNTYYSFVVWVNQTQNNSDAKYYVNSPSCFYITSLGATDDINRCSNYTIPSEFTGTGFLVARVTLRYQTVDSGTITEIATEDLRGLQPSTAAGGGGVSAGAEFPDNLFRVQAVADNTAEIAMSASAITTANTRTITMADGDVDLSGASSSDVLTWDGTDWGPAASSGGLTWGDSVNNSAAATTTGVTLNATTNITTTGIGAQTINVTGQTQTGIRSHGVLINLNSNTSTNQFAKTTGVDILVDGANGEMDTTSTTNTAWGKGAAFRASHNGAGLSQTLFAGIIGSNANALARGFELKLEDTQSSAITMQKIDTGTSAQGHIAYLANVYNASTGARGFYADASNTGTGDLFHAKTTHGITSTSGNIFKYDAETVIGSGAETDFALGVNYRNKNLGQLIQADHKMLTSVSRTTDFIDIELNIKDTGNGTSNFDMSYINRINDSAGAGTSTHQGSVAHFQNTATQTSGTLADTVVVGQFTQDSDSTGDIINATNGTNTVRVDSFGGLIGAKVTADPCGSMDEGAMFYNDTSNYYCYCNGTNDVKMSDDTTACF